MCGGGAASYPDVAPAPAGKATPTGGFTILQRKVDHESSIYKGAKMPHMQRLTWDGIAIHAGRLPGSPRRRVRARPGGVARSSTP